MHWRREIEGTGNQNDFANAVALDAAGNAVAAGVLTNAGTSSDFTVVRLAAATGAELWRYVISDPGSSVAGSVVMTATGDVVAAGFTRPGSTRMCTAVKLAGASGAELWRFDTDGECEAVAAHARGPAQVVGDRGILTARVGPPRLAPWLPARWVRAVRAWCSPD